MSTNQLNIYLKEFETYLPKYNTKNLKVSKATVGWQIDHSLKVINNVCLALQNSEPSNYKNNISFLGKFLLIIGKFPRGKAKAPQHVKPPEVIEKNVIACQIEDAKKNIKSINTLPENAYFKHPMFGHINKKRVTRFLEVHTKHHLKIIRDIIK